ncbi:MAG: tRNA pseudouridine(55) synthase TruB [Actinomycetota bacterium]|nr:tRNA pseudouridine(55) synthase TruB [Actinomycetota bacterium]
MIDGLVVVDKPPGMTSHDVVAQCRRIFQQRRVGHAGTLDPDATGVLLVGLGGATRLLQFLSGHPKSYDAEVVLGVATSTLDSSGTASLRRDMTGTTLAAARTAAAELTGEIDQVPPMVSAIKIGGRRLPELARAGVEVDRPPRRVTVSRFDVDWAEDQDVGPLGGGPVLAASVDCSAGTYVRTLAADLGSELGGCAHLRRLRRLAVGGFAAPEAVPLDQLGPGAVLPPAGALRGMATVSVSADLAVAVGHGKILETTDLDVDGPGPWAVLGTDGDLLAVYHPHGHGRVKPVVVMAVRSL